MTSYEKYSYKFLLETISYGIESLRFNVWDAIKNFDVSIDIITAFGDFTQKKVHLTREFTHNDYNYITKLFWLLVT